MINFTYLHYPPQLYRTKPKVSEALGTNLLGQPTRKLFHKVPYTQYQLSQIKQFRIYAENNHPPIDCSDMQILRYLYSNNFSPKQTLEKLTIYLSWIHSPQIQTISSATRAILSSGFIFTYGRDRSFKPVVYLNITKTNFLNYSLDDHYSAVNTVMNAVINECFVPGVIETYLFVIDMEGNNFTSLPIQQIGAIIKKLSIVYSMYLGTLLVINCPTFVKFTYSAIKIFIHEETRKKMHLLGVNELSKLTEYVDSNQLYKKYGGNNKNPSTFWPPEVPARSVISPISNVSTMGYLEDQTVYYSVEQNQSFFEDDRERDMSGERICCKGCHGNQCRIF